ncbi:MAG: hypothetical protein LBT14_10755 [Treponema sp.]|jgi:heptaprenyl diphosphate synthase|nr:hypothetical protein [Treponema sp.]
MKEPRRVLWGNRFRSGDLFIAGLVMMAAFLGNPSTLLRTLQLLLFLVYARLGGKRNNLLMTLMVMLGIVVFNLLVPYGKVLVEFGIFPLTQGALVSGLHKAVTLEGLIMLSKATIRSDLRLPGPLGSLLGESFRIFERITERKGLITRKHFIEGIDELMLELSAEQKTLATANQPVARNQQDPEHPRATAPWSRLTDMLLLLTMVVPVVGLTMLSHDLQHIPN